MAYVFQTNLLAPDAAFSVPQQEAISDEDALDLVLSISDTHSGGTAASASGAVAENLVSSDRWQLNQLLKNIRVAYENQQDDPLDPVNGLVACDYDQVNTKLNVQRWILDMCGVDSVDVVLGNAPGTTTSVDLSAGHAVAAKGDFADTLEGGADGTVSPGTNTKDNDKKRAGGAYDFIDALSTAIAFAWVKGTDVLPGGAATAADHATANGATDLWERTLRFRNQIVQDRIRTDVLDLPRHGPQQLRAGQRRDRRHLVPHVAGRPVRHPRHHLGLVPGGEQRDRKRLGRPVADRHPGIVGSGLGHRAGPPYRRPLAAPQPAGRLGRRRRRQRRH